MFKNRKIFVIALVLTIFVFTGCSGKMKVREFFEKSKEANDKIHSLVLDDETKNTTKESTSIQTLHAELINNVNNKKIIKGNGYIRYKGKVNKEEVDYDVVFVGDSKKTLIKTTKVDGKEKKEEKQGSGYYVNPDYYKLLDGIYALKEKDLELEEKNDEYHLNLKSGSKNLKVFEILKSQYKLNLTTVTEYEVDLKFEAVFDKKTFYLKSIVWSIEYNGKKGPFKIEDTTKYSEWNNTKVEGTK